VQIFGSARAGSALRQAPRAPEASTSGPGLYALSAPSPHVRKAHWQSYWKGKPTQEVKKSMLLKWKPPKIINGRDDDSLEAAIRFMNQIKNQPERRCVDLILYKLFMDKHEECN